MNKLFLSLAFLFSVLVLNAQNNIVDFDYTKVFSINSMWIDFNQDKKAQSDEIYNLPDNAGEMFIEYKDFGSARNRIKINMIVKNNGKVTTFRANCEDIVLLKLKNGFGVYNKEFDECWFSIIKMDGNVHALVFNPAIFEY